MRTKLYFGVLALIWLFSSCSQTPNVSYRTQVGTTFEGYDIYSITIDEHKYLEVHTSITHSGDCPKCRHTMDSIVRVAIHDELVEYEELLRRN